MEDLALFYISRTKYDVSKIIQLDLPLVKKKVGLELVVRVMAKSVSFWPWPGTAIRDIIVRDSIALACSEDLLSSVTKELALVAVQE